jgi:hypothetical protein
MLEVIRSLPGRAGRGSVRGTLEAVARAVLASGSDGEWLQARAAVAAYLRREQELGRIDAGCDPEQVAGVLLSACERRALHLRVLGDAALGSAGGFAAELARTLTRTLVSPNAETGG